jgi:hypothetical protein
MILATPTGVAPVLHVKGNPLGRCTRAGLATTLLGLRNSFAVLPRVAEYSNPWAGGRIPFGENVQTSNPPNALVDR